MKKYQLFCGILGALVSANAVAYDTIKAEDEYLLRDVIKVNGDKYIVETKKSIESEPIEYLGDDEALVVDDIAFSESAKRKTDNVVDKFSHPRDRYLSGESAKNAVKKPIEKKTLEIMTDDGEVFVVDGDSPRGFETKEDYIDGINECYDNNRENLSDAITLYDSGFKGALANVTNIMAEINHCYEQIGYAIIADYYGGDKFMMKNFDEESKKFYVSGTGVDFDPKFCDDNCSVKAIIDAQVAKFSDFRTYLAKLLDGK